MRLPCSLSQEHLHIDFNVETQLTVEMPQLRRQQTMDMSSAPPAAAVGGQEHEKQTEASPFLMLLLRNGLPADPHYNPELPADSAGPGRSPGLATPVAASTDVASTVGSPRSVSEAGSVAGSVAAGATGPPTKRSNGLGLAAGARAGAGVSSGVATPPLDCDSEPPTPAGRDTSHLHAGATPGPHEVHRRLDPSRVAALTPRSRGTAGAGSGVGNADGASDGGTPRAGGAAGAATLPDGRPMAFHGANARSGGDHAPVQAAAPMASLSMQVFLLEVVEDVEAVKRAMLALGFSG